jgi:hypothetical protein
MLQNSRGMLQGRNGKLQLQDCNRTFSMITVTLHCLDHNTFQGVLLLFFGTFKVFQFFVDFIGRFHITLP